MAGELCTTKRKRDIMIKESEETGETRMIYAKAGKAELEKEKQALDARYKEYEKMHLSLDMSRGKPGEAQLALSEGLLTVLNSGEQTVCEGIDCRNYGGFEGLPSLRKIFADLLEAA